uniref:BTB domain-containing protein n=1 Tax=Panagrolaimus sp. ES5 TaxID=591445 RepID=A0AC34G5L3_9BILA
MAAVKNLVELQLIKFDLFKTQDPENGRFDVIFEIKDKLLYAHKPMLNLVSDTFDSMLSERWASKDEPIKIENYTFDEFYQFITFLYSGECQLTAKNIFFMVDISEFYNVKCFKNYCDEFVSKMEFTSENIFQFLELTDKYSLVQLISAIQTYIANNFENFIDSKMLLTAKKSIIAKIVVNNDKCKPEDLFRIVYNFLHEFVVPRGFIFGSLDELSKVLCSSKPENKVKVTNSNGQILLGKLYGEKSTVVDNIKSLNVSSYANTSICWWEPKFRIPKEPSEIKVNKKIEWYLIYFLSGRIGVLRRVDIGREHYLLAELEAENEFTLTRNCKIEVRSDF